MENSWMLLPNRLSKEYRDGLKSFIEVTKNNLDGNNKLRCPCRDCLEAYFHDLVTINKHLFVRGFSYSYAIRNNRGISKLFVQHKYEEPSQSGPKGPIKLFHDTHYNTKNGWTCSEAESCYVEDEADSAQVGKCDKAENKKRDKNKGDEEEDDEEEGQRPHIADYYRTSHWSKRKKELVDPKCKENYDELQKLKKRSMQPGATPMSEEKMSVLVLGKKSGYLRGYGVDPKPCNTSRDKGQSQARDEEVRTLREKLASLEGLYTRQQQQIEMQQECIEAQDKKFEDFQAYTMKMLAKIRRRQGGESSSGDFQDAN